MKKPSIARMETDPRTTRWLLMSAQVLSLVAYLMALRFLRHTTGLTLFVFATFAPGVVGIATLLLIGVIVYKFRRRHSLFTYESFQPGETICHQGEDADCAYFIHSGEVEVSQRTNDGDKVIAKLSPGQYFGEMALITSQPRNATVRAVSPAKVAVLGKQNFLTMVTLMPSTKEDIMKTVQERAMQQAAQ